MPIFNNRETIIEDVESINIENSEKIAKKSKKEMREKTDANNEVSQDAKPKLIIKIPKPFALGYIVIDLSKLLGNLLKGLAAGIAALVLAKIAAALTKLLQDKLSKGGVSQNDIDDAFNNTDINGIISESEKEYNNQKSDDSEIDPSLKDDGKVIDIYSKANQNKKNISNKNKYTIDQRNRKDILDSDAVNERNGSNNKNIKTVRNPNYGIYLD